MPVRRGDMPAPSRGLIDDGFGHKLLLSQDVFLKMMLTRYGGFGYAYVLRHFVPRLRRHGVPRRRSDACSSTIRARVFSPLPEKALEIDDQEEGPARRRKLGRLRHPLQGLRPVRLDHLPSGRRAAGRGAERQRVRPALHAGARGGDRVPADAGRPGALRRGDPVRHRRQHAAAAPRRLAERQDRAQPAEAPARLCRSRRRPDDDRRLFASRASTVRALAQTPVEEVLPVTCLPIDDRLEIPEGFRAELVEPDHPILAGLPASGRSCSASTRSC